MCVLCDGAGLESHAAGDTAAHSANYLSSTARTRVPRGWDDLAHISNVMQCTQVAVHGSAGAHAKTLLACTWTLGPGLETCSRCNFNFDIPPQSLPCLACILDLAYPLYSTPDFTLTLAMISLATAVKFFLVFIYGQLQAAEAEAKIWRMLYERDRRCQYSPPPVAIEDGVTRVAGGDVLAINPAQPATQAARSPCPAPENALSDPNPVGPDESQARRATACQTVPGTAADGQQLGPPEDEDCGFVLISSDAIEGPVPAAASAPSALPDVPQTPQGTGVAHMATQIRAHATAPTRQKEQSLAASCAW